MKRFRDCGCDTRDAGTYVQTGESPLLCSAFDDGPCCWVAQFGCHITVNDNQITSSYDGNVFLRVNCAFDLPCKFVSDESNVHIDGHWGYWDPDGPYIAPQLRCTWFARYWGQELGGGPYGLRWIISEGWILDLSSLDDVTLELPSLGIVYEADASWDVTGPNTMTMTSDPTLVPQLPRKVCVVPMEYTDNNPGAKHLCDIRSPPVEHDLCDDNIPCGYSDADRRACGDDCCDQAVSFTLVCGEETATIAGTSSESDVEGTCSPAGRSIMLEGSVTFGGTSYDIKFVMYCDGADWLVDVYCDGVLDQSCLVSTFTKCPFSATVTIPELSCMNCDAVETDCCPDDPVPTTLTATIVGSGACSTCVDSVIEIVWDGTEWTGTTGTLNCVLDSFTITIKLKCVGTDWQIAIETTCATTWPYQNVVGVTCNPFEAARSVSLDDCCDTGSAGLTVTITA